MDLDHIGIEAASSLMRAGTLTSEQLVSAKLARIAKFDGHLNSFITIFGESALDEARNLDREFQSGAVRSVLHGIPIAIKDVFDIEGVPTTAAMPSRLNASVKTTATVVSRLRRAGAVIIGKTNLAEGVYAEHVAPFGPAINPWRSDLWPGASSSGSGVAMAAGFCCAALATDTGGSIRLPSAANGVTGIKPTWGRVSRHGVFELAASLDHVGPMATSASDAGLLLKVISGPDVNDPTAVLTPPFSLSVRGADLEGVRIGYDREWATKGVDHETVANLEAAIATYRELGASIVDVQFPDPTQIVEDWFGVCAVQTARSHSDMFGEHGHTYGGALRSLIELGKSLSACDYDMLLVRRSNFAGKVETLLSSIDALILPVLAFPIPTLTRMQSVDPEMISGLHRYTCSFTMSRHPTITMPSGITRDGAPTAIQLVARYFHEPLLIALGTEFQNATQWHKNRPPL